MVEITPHPVQNSEHHMNKPSAFLLSLLVTIIIAINLSLLLPSSIQRETTSIERSIDGDTLELADGRIIRLVNINTPEKNTPGYKEATQFLVNYEHTQVEIEITALDKYNRYLGRIYAPDYINLQIIKEGLGNTFLVAESELKEFKKAEESAIKNEKGVWKHSPYYDCIDSDIDEKREKVTLTVTCPELIKKTVTLKDESRKQEKIILSEEKLTINTHKGKNTQGELFLGLTDSLWNDDRDTLYIFDDNYQLIHTHHYGYR
ncbi:MAG TPA: thermonuclease family protein [Candidatus Nanoarchaeia archaeon]|nr:thermonuclease family protein [Candidatus Nanoarchaeia archaeon]